MTLAADYLCNKMSPFPQKQFKRLKYANTDCIIITFYFYQNLAAGNVIKWVQCDFLGDFQTNSERLHIRMILFFHWVYKISGIAFFILKIHPCMSTYITTRKILEMRV